MSILTISVFCSIQSFKKLNKQNKIETFAKHTQISFLFLLTPLLSQLAAEKIPFLSSWALVCVNTIVGGTEPQEERIVTELHTPKGGSQ